MKKKIVIAVIAVAVVAAAVCAVVFLGGGEKPDLEKLNIVENVEYSEPDFKDEASPAMLCYDFDSLDLSEYEQTDFYDYTCYVRGETESEVGIVDGEHSERSYAYKYYKDEYQTMLFTEDGKLYYYLNSWAYFADYGQEQKSYGTYYQDGKVVCYEVALTGSDAWAFYSPDGELLALSAFVQTEKGLEPFFYDADRKQISLAKFRQTVPAVYGSHEYYSAGSFYTE